MTAHVPRLARAAGLALALAAATPGVSADGDLPVIYFGSSSASLTGKDYDRLHAVAAALKAEPAMKLEIGGYADASGHAPSNLALSTARARAVHDFLVSLGIDHRRLAVKAYGASGPVNDNSTLELRAYNRRVQFRRLD